MKLALLLCLMLLLYGCASRVTYTPRLPCPDLPLLADDATHEQIVDHDAQVVKMYGECRKARRVNPRKDATQ
jgi:hypothetical protein